MSSGACRKGLQQGLRQGQLGLLADLLAERFGALDGAVQARLEQADEETLKALGPQPAIGPEHG